MSEGQLRGQEVQTYEAKWDGLAENELGMSEVHSDRGVEIREDIASTGKNFLFSGGWKKWDECTSTDLGSTFQ